MSVHPFPYAGHRLLPHLSEAGADLAAADAVEVAGLGDAELAEAVVALAELESRAVALRMKVGVEAEARQLAAQQAFTGTDAWMAQLTGDTRTAMKGGLLVARLLQEKYHHAREAFAAGKLNFKQAKIIVDAAEAIPDWATREQVATAEDWLVGRATGTANRSGRGVPAARLRQVARRMCRVVDQRLADEHADVLLRRREGRGQAETWFRLSDNGDGTWSGRFVIDDLHGRLLQHALQRLSAPRRMARTATGELVDDPTHSGLNYYEGLGLAFCELVEHLPEHGHTSNGTTLLVRIDLDQLLSGIGMGTLDAGGAISAGEARRLACEAGIIAGVFGGDSLPLDLGRETRLHSRHQRMALAMRHDTCAAEGCDRPFAWTEIHHPHWFSRGGRTDLVNAVPLCHWHHRRAHDDRWDLRQHTDGQWRFHRRT